MNAHYTTGLASAGLTWPVGSRRGGANRALPSSRAKRRAFDRRADQLIQQYARKYDAPDGAHQLPPKRLAELESKLDRLRGVYL